MEPRPLRKLVCPVCGKTFETLVRKQKYCSQDCFRLKTSSVAMKPEGPCPPEWQEGFNRRIGRNLRRMREESGLTRRHVQMKTGIIWQTLEGWEDGKNSIPLYKAVWMCKKLGWKLSDLLKSGG